MVVDELQQFIRYNDAYKNITRELVDSLVGAGLHIDHKLGRILACNERNLCVHIKQNFRLYNTQSIPSLPLQHSKPVDSFYYLKIFKDSSTFSKATR